MAETTEESEMPRFSTFSAHVKLRHLSTGIIQAKLAKTITCTVSAEGCP